MKLLQDYYDRFNARDVEGFLALLHPDVVHEVSQGETRVGVEAFREFLGHMNRCYRETVSELVIFSHGERGAAELMLDGEYLATDGDLPPAHGQRYRLRVGAFFEVKEGRISRVSNHYNIQDWLRQIAR